MLKKRGQVSTFVIVGVIILFVFIFIFLLRDSIREKFKGAVNKEEYLSSELNNIQRTIEKCTTKETINSAKLLGEHGFYFEPIDYVTYYGTKIAVSCNNVKEQKYCNAKPINKEDVNIRLNNQLKEKIKQCIDLSSYRKKDYTLETGEFEIQTLIEENDIQLEVNYPITLKLEETETRNNQYKTQVKIPLGKAIKLSNEIISQEASTGNYDIISSSVISKGEYTIRERKPYPNKIYIIDFWNGKYKFNIGIEGER